MKTIKLSGYRVLNTDHVVSIRIKRSAADDSAMIIFELDSGREERQGFDDFKKARKALDELIEYLES